MTTFKPNKYIPALRFDLLIAVDDPVVRLTYREIAFKTALIEQAKFEPVQNILDLGCGSGTLAILSKRKFPQTQ